MGFKEMVREDIEDVFFNLKEFADIHTINGVRMACIVDSNELIERERRQTAMQLYRQGIHLKELMIYVQASDFGPLPAIGRSLALDGRNYLVTDAVDECGVYSITVEAVRG